MNISQSKRSRPRTAKKAVSRSAAQIAAIIEEVRPSLAAHGGDVEFVSYERGTVSLRFTGACSLCQYASLTLGEIVRRIRAKVKSAKRIKLV